MASIVGKVHCFCAVTYMECRSHNQIQSYQLISPYISLSFGKLFRASLRLVDAVCFLWLLVFSFGLFAFASAARCCAQQEYEDAHTSGQFGIESRFVFRKKEKSNITAASSFFFFTIVLSLSFILKCHQRQHQW